MTKQQIRERFKQDRATLSDERREQAAHFAKQFLSQWVEDWLSSHPNENKYLLSFASFSDEIDLWPFNRWLVQKGLLALPKVVGDALTPHKVTQLSDQLTKSPLGILEPAGCPELSQEELIGVLVPGLVFDTEMHRLGWGAGYYDHFLSSLPEDLPKLGVGFKEQFYPTPLPVSDHDILLTHRFLF